MDPSLYFSVFVGFLILCVVGSIAYKQHTRPCPACGADTPVQARRCRHCEYLFGRV